MSEAGWRAWRFSMMNFIVRPVSMMSSTSTTCREAICSSRSLIRRTAPEGVVVSPYEVIAIKSIVIGTVMARVRSAMKYRAPLSTLTSSGVLVV